jgi:hypothetical protein
LFALIGELKSPSNKGHEAVEPGAIEPEPDVRKAKKPRTSTSKVQPIQTKIGIPNIKSIEDVYQQWHHSLGVGDDRSPLKL